MQWARCSLLVPCEKAFHGVNVGQSPCSMSLHPQPPPHSTVHVHLNNQLHQRIKITSTEQNNKQPHIFFSSTSELFIGQNRKYDMINLFLWGNTLFTEAPRLEQKPKTWFSVCVKVMCKYCFSTNGLRYDWMSCIHTALQEAHRLHSFQAAPLQAVLHNGAQTSCCCWSRTGQRCRYWNPTGCKCFLNLDWMFSEKCVTFPLSKFRRGGWSWTRRPDLS